MLQNIRDNVQGIFAKIIMAMIIVPFALFGIDSLLSGGGVVNVAEVNGEEVSERELQRRMVMQKRNMLSRMGENADPSLLDDGLIRAQVLQRLIEETVLLQKAEDNSLGLSARQIDQMIVGMDQFQENGQFSPELYQNVLRNNGYTSTFFKALLTTELLIQQLNSGVSSTVFVTEPELMEIASIVGENRSYRYMLLPLDVTAEVEISSSQVSEYYEQHESDFLREEQLELEYIELKKEQFYESVDEATLRQAFEEELSAFSASEERRVSHIFIEINDTRSGEQAKLVADSLAQQLQSGDSFEALAKTNSDDIGSASMGGDLGYTKGDTFPDDFESVLFTLELGAVSAPVITDDGVHLIKLTDIKAGEQPVFEERRDLIEQRIQSTTADAEFITVLEDLRDYVFNSSDLAGPADSLELTVHTTNWLSKSSSESIFSHSRVKNRAFTDDILLERNNSEVIELAPNHFIVVRVKNYRATEPFTLKEVEPEIQALLKQQHVKDQLIILAEKLKTQLLQGGKIQEIAQSNNYEWQIEIDKTRNSASVNRELLIAAFKATQINSYQSVPLADGSVAILSLEKITSGNLQSLSTAERRAIVQEINRNYANWDVSWYLKSALAASEISQL